ncbi:MAG: hypothetical protein AAGL99_03215 [Pseudomonadota bacterium]
MPRFEQACLDRAWPILCQVIAMLSVGLRDIRPGAPNLLRLRHLVRLGESMMRRWLLVTALSEGMVAQSRGTSPIPQTPAQPGVHGLIIANFSAGTSNPWIPAFAGIDGARENTPHSNRASLFRLFERERKHHASAQTGPFGSGPRLTWLDQARHRESPVSAPLKPTLTRLNRRTAALQAVIDNPKKHVERMAKWLVRAAKTCRRIFPLRVGDPPGASHRQRRKDPERQSVLSALNNLSWELRYRKRSP